MKNLLCTKERLVCINLALLMCGLWLLPLASGIHAQSAQPCPTPYIDTLLPTAAKPGDEVKIRGKRFGTEAGKVTFAPGVKAEIVSWANRRIWVIVPESATTGPISVSRPCGSVSNTKYFTVQK